MTKELIIPVFKIGQTIEYVRKGKFDWEEIDEAAQAGLVLGNTVTVCEVDDDAIKIEESDADTWIHPLHFQAV